MFTINTPMLVDMMGHDPESDILIINVMPPSEFTRSHIAGSKNVPIEESDFVDEVESLAGDKRRRIVVYCSNEKCDAATVAAKRLEEAGFAQVYEYLGGTSEWEKAGMPLEAGAEA